VTEELAVMGLLFRADADTIVCFANSVALLEDAERALAVEGPMRIDRDGDSRRNPWLMVRQQALDGIHRFGSALGLSPTARARLELPSPRSAQDALAARLLS
jgi:P27 family predicted phage terminase small subunit